MKYYTQIGYKFVISKNIILMRNLNLLLIATIILLVSCTNLIPDTLFTGRWGGQGISVLVSDTQVTLDFNCASGTISKKVILSNNLFLEKEHTHKIQEICLLMQFYPNLKLSSMKEIYQAVTFH